MLRLQHHKHHYYKVERCERLKKHARAYLVFVTITVKMDHADNGNKGQKHKRYNLVKVKHAYVCYRSKGPKTLHMKNKSIQLVCVYTIASHKPIRRKHTHQCCTQGACRAGQDVCKKKHKSNGKKIKNLDKLCAGYSQHCKSIKHGSCSSFVLISLEEEQEKCDKEQLHDATWQRHEQELCHHHKHDERTRHHATVYAYERIGIVQLHHQE